MLLSTLLSRIAVKETSLDLRSDAEIRGVTSRSSEVRRGWIFVALKGEKRDGCVFAKDVSERGAAFVVADRLSPEIVISGIPYVITDNARKAHAILTSAFYGDPQRSMTVIGVTGTNGKTTVVRLISNALRSAGKRVFESGTLTGNMTTPDVEELYKTLSDARKAGSEYGIFEVSSHALAQYKVEPVDFSLGIFTNLTRDHLDFHKDMQSYAECKSRLFGKCAASLICADDRYSSVMAGASAGEKYFYSAEKNTDFYAKNIVFDDNITRFDLETPFGETTIGTHLYGLFNVRNAVAAASACFLLGLSSDQVRRGIAATKSVPGRLERIRTDFGADIYVDYAHTPDALENALVTLRPLTEKRLAVLFGCGGDRDRGKRSEMGRIAEKYADVLYVTSDNDRTEDRMGIIRDILSGIARKDGVYVIPDRKEAVERAVGEAERGDVILLAGKGHENYVIDNDGKKDFNEREIAAEAAKKRIRDNDD